MAIITIPFVQYVHKEKITDQLSSNWSEIVGINA